MHFEGSLRGAVPNTNARAYLYDRNARAYTFQLHAEVAGVSPAAGSQAGGTLLTITGRGFPQNLTEAGNTRVLVGGRPCVLKEVAFDYITCLTAGWSGEVPTAFNGRYPGMRGVEWIEFRIT